MEFDYMFRENLRRKSQIPKGDNEGVKDVEQVTADTESPAGNITMEDAHSSAATDQGTPMEDPQLINKDTEALWAELYDLKAKYDELTARMVKLEEQLERREAETTQTEEPELQSVLYVTPQNVGEEGRSDGNQ